MTKVFISHVKGACHFLKHIVREDLIEKEIKVNFEQIGVKVFNLKFMEDGEMFNP